MIGGNMAREKQWVIGICAMLAVVTLFSYWPITHHGFVNIDDNEYIIDNPHVNTGLKVANVVWAMGSGYASNWHPLTWVSHMMDCQLFGMDAGKHHLTTLLFHTADTVLVFLLLFQMTGATWRSAFVAALFGWHPLHVESVAWASERKDVLSTFFWMLTLMAYVRYARGLKVESGAQSRGGKAKIFYGLALLFFALGLMSKPMLVTLPCVMLLMDFWPLRRGVDGESDTQPALASMPWVRLVVEKVPFFAMAFAASLVTYWVQKTGGAVSSLEELSFASRAGNAALAYVRYISKTVWPVDLAALYPYPAHIAVGAVVGAVLFLVGITWLFVLAARRRPYLLVGWFWFVGTLVPTIGLIQVGSQSMADRYMYIPSVGFFILIAWGAYDLLAGLPLRRAVLAATGAMALGACVAGTLVQIKYWRDSVQLFQHAILVTKDNYIAENGLGGALKEFGKNNEAKALFAHVVRVKPRYAEGQYNLGTSLLDEGNVEEAMVHFNAALAVSPDMASAHSNLGKALTMQGKLNEAMVELSKAVTLKPGLAQVHYNLGTVLLTQAKVDEAIAEFSEALRLEPKNAETHGNLAVALMRKGRVTEGTAQFAEAVRLKPNDAGAHLNLGIALLEQDQLKEATAQFGEVLRLNPDDAKAHYELANALSRQHKSKQAMGEYREVLRLKPESSEALNNLAWMLSTDANAELRDGKEGVRLAEKACGLVGFKEAETVLTLAAAYAEEGRFEEATVTAQKAQGLAVAAGQKDIAARGEESVRLYQAKKPFRQLD
ncbi:MAG: Tetratricopeptide 2 repeat protein [Pedosphaera sp.]|nr:Tetratricopeptide 2 repeat protein [Pedosphaera sp.]